MEVILEFLKYFASYEKSFNELSEHDIIDFVYRDR